MQISRTYKYKLYPSKSQTFKLNQTLELCRKIYNDTLSIRKITWESERKSLSKYDTNKILTKWKKENSELKFVHSQVAQNVQERVDLAFQTFFRHQRNKKKCGYPRFKGEGRYDSFTFPQSGFSLNENKLKISKIGNVKIKIDRAIDGKIKRLTIHKSPTGKWFACFNVEKEIEQNIKPNSKCVGIDLGLSQFIIGNDGLKIDNPHFFKQEQKELAKVQRRYQKNKTKKNKHTISLVHERIKNKRNDFIHKISRQMVETYDIICMEQLNIKNMQKGKGDKHKKQTSNRNKSITDVAWRSLIEKISYKAEEAGKISVLVNPCNTSKMCSGCGKIVNKDVSIRVHECECGLVLDRDLNASINILRLGLQSLRRNDKIEEIVDPSVFEFNL